ncbi:MAG: hydantoinase/oxoprolinase family protein [Thermosphaera sp.]
MTSRYRVGIDIGGTFTDFVLFSDQAEELFQHKRLTTPQDPAEGALLGLDELLKIQGLNIADLDAIIHGTTLVTNAMIERRGCKTGLLTTRGFRDILEMGHEQRYDIYDLFLRFPEPLVPRRLRIEIDERISRDGEPLKVPDLNQVALKAKGLLEEGVEAVAVCFLHAYRNASHEQEVAQLLRREFPKLAVSVSSEVVPEIREYERTTTTTANAYVQPLMDRYLARLERALARAGFKGRFFLMQSSGGSATTDTARKFPIRLLESGPAGGALVTAFLGRALAMPNLLSFDMGGTTAKACLIRNGQPQIAPVMEVARVHRFKRGSGLPIKVPVVDMIEIGAGGGSIAYADKLGLLKVGPQSAGADPGPACYGLGGKQATVTDACLLLGYFDPDYFLGGAMSLDVPAAQRALALLGERLRLAETETAWGVFRTVCENMAGAARVHIIEKGEDPRRFPIMAFGGAGPAHAARVARILRSPEVIIPPMSGVASALGFLVAPTSFEFSRSYPGELRELDWTAVARLYGELEEQARDVLARAGVPQQDVRLERYAEMRLLGQFHDIDIAVPDGQVSEEMAVMLAKSFEEEYSRLFHTVLLDYEPMVLNWRLRATGPEPKIAFSASASAPEQDLAVSEAHKGERLAFFPEAGDYLKVAVYDRYRLPAGAVLEGPLIVEERESTTIANPGDVLTVDAWGNLRIKVVVLK